MTLAIAETNIDGYVADLLSFVSLCMQAKSYDESKSGAKCTHSAKGWHFLDEMMITVVYVTCTERWKQVRLYHTVRYRSWKFHWSTATTHKFTCYLCLCARTERLCEVNKINCMQNIDVSQSLPSHPSTTAGGKGWDGVLLLQTWAPEAWKITRHTCSCWVAICITLFLLRTGGKHEKSLHSSICASSSIAWMGETREWKVETYYKLPLLPVCPDVQAKCTTKHRILYTPNRRDTRKHGKLAVSFHYWCIALLLMAVIRICKAWKSFAILSPAAAIVSPSWDVWFRWKLFFWFLLHFSRFCVFFFTTQLFLFSAIAFSINSHPYVATLGVMLCMRWTWHCALCRIVGFISGAH